MKIPRGISADRLIRMLKQLGYEAIRQKGSHARLRHSGPPIHLLTIPMHKTLKVGTLHGVLSEVAHMRSMTIESLIDLL